MFVYVSGLETTQAVSHVEVAFDELIHQLHDVDDVQMKILTGQKGLTTSNVIVAEFFKAGAGTKIAEILGNWLIKDRSRSLRIKIGDRELEATGISKQEQAELIQWFERQSTLYLPKT